MPETKRGLGGTVREAALTTGALLGLICVAAAVAAVVFGITPLVFRSGSMEPAIDTGSLALAQTVPAVDVGVGDVISVVRTDGTNITHRVADIVDVNGNTAELVLKGDANDVADPDTYIITDADRVVVHVPYMGYFVTWLNTPYAWGIGTILSTSLILTAWRPSGKAKPPKHSSGENLSGKHSVVASVVLVTVTATVIGIGTSRTEMTLAAATDSAYGKTTVTAETVVRPPNFACNPGALGTTTLSWTNVNQAYSYQLAVTPAGAGFTSPMTINPSANATITYQLNSLNVLLAFRDYTFVLTSKVGNFVSATSRTWVVNFASALSITCVSSSASSSAAFRSAPQALGPSPTPSQEATASVDPTSTTEPTMTATASPTTATMAAPTTTAAAATTTAAAPTTTVPPTTTTTVPAPAPSPTTTTTPPPPVALAAPQTSPSGASTAQVVDIDGSPTLQIVDSAGAIQYSAPATSSDAYGYGVNWSAGDQLWLLGPDQLVRLDSAGGSWTRTLVDPAATDQIPAGILALIK